MYITYFNTHSFHIPFKYCRLNLGFSLNTYTNVAHNDVIKNVSNSPPKNENYGLCQDLVS